jgi:hypothetical protein
MVRTVVVRFPTDVPEYSEIRKIQVDFGITWPAAYKIYKKKQVGIWKNL